MENFIVVLGYAIGLFIIICLIALILYLFLLFGGIFIMLRYNSTKILKILVLSVY